MVKKPLRQPYDFSHEPRRQNMALELQKLWLAKGLTDKDVMRRLNNVGVHVTAQMIGHIRLGQDPPSQHMLKMLCLVLHLDLAEKLRLWRAKAVDDGYEI